MTREMTPADAREIDWEEWADRTGNAGYELAQPAASEDGSWPITVTARDPGDSFLMVRMSVPSALLSAAPDHVIIRPWREVIFIR